MDATRIRSMLFVPGDSSRKLAKAPNTQADALIVDWEDAVADANKEFAREVTGAAMPGLLSGQPIVLIRINASNPALVVPDCRAVAELRPDGVVVPGCQSVSSVRELIQGLPDGTAVFPLIESPLGVLRSAEIASSADQVPGLMFGAEDYSAEARILRSEGEPELTYARSAVVTAARAVHREVFDSPPMQYQDLETVRRSARRARRMGFTGQAVIHPDQVAIVNQAFTPSDVEVSAANTVLDRYRGNEGGSYGVDGRLEDRPAVKHALSVLARIR